MPPHPLTNFGTQRHYQNKPKLNDVYSHDNPHDKMKDGAYVINLDEYADVGTHWIVLYKLNYDATYFDSFMVEHIPKEIKRFIGNKNMETNILRIQVNNSVMCGYLCITIIDFMFAGKTLIDFSSLFSPHDFKKNDKIILGYAIGFSYRMQILTLR